MQLRGDLLGELDGGARAGRSAHWTAVVRAALDEYPALETHIGKQLKLPADLQIWRDAL